MRGHMLRELEDGGLWELVLHLVDYMCFVFGLILKAQLGVSYLFKFILKTLLFKNFRDYHLVYKIGVVLWFKK